MSFSNKKVWVTGAGQGIGARTAEMFRSYGASVVGFDKSFSSGEHHYLTVELDITDAKTISEVCREFIVNNEGPDILVNSAGILRLGRMSELTSEDWDKCIAVNASGPFYLMRELIPHFKYQRRGSIINVASNASHVPRLGMAAYCASKAALTSLSHCVGLELAEFGVRCNLVSPGSTETRMLQQLWADSPETGRARIVEGSLDQYKLGIPLGKLATVDDIANTILFLASDMASHITLQDIVVDGGATLGA